MTTRLDQLQAKVERARAKVEKARAERRAKDIAMIGDQDRWPQWPWLPIKRYDSDGRLETAIAYAGGERNEIIMGANLFDLSLARLDRAERKQYESVEQLVDDGWTVD